MTLYISLRLETWFLSLLFCLDEHNWDIRKSRSVPLACVLEAVALPSAFVLRVPSAFTWHQINTLQRYLIEIISSQCGIKYV